MHEIDKPDSDVDRSVARFGAFRLDLEVGELRRDGELVSLRPKAVEVLVLLVEARGRMVPRERLVDGVWGDTHVDIDAALHTAIREVRQALGDDASQPRFVETVHRRGYRFIAELEMEERSSAGPAAVDTAADESGSAWRRWMPVTAALLVIAVVVVGSWLALPGESPVPSSRRGAFDPTLAASDAVLRGRHLVNHGGEEELFAGMRMLREAVAGGDAGMLAWAGLAIGELRLGRFVSAREAAERALELDPRSAEALRALGQIELIFGRDLAAAERLLLRALELDPASGKAHHAYSTLLMATGRSDEAVRMAETALALAPSAIGIRVNLARYRLYTGDLDGALQEVRTVLAEQADHAIALDILQVTLWIRGETEAARDAAMAFIEARGAPDAVLEPLRRAPPGEGFRGALLWRIEDLQRHREMGTNRHVRAALLCVQVGDLDRAIAQLRRVGERPSALLPLVLEDPRLEPLAEHPLMIELRRRYQAAG